MTIINHGSSPDGEPYDALDIDHLRSEEAYSNLAEGIPTLVRALVINYQNRWRYEPLDVVEQSPTLVRDLVTFYNVLFGENLRPCPECGVMTEPHDMSLFSCWRCENDLEPEVNS
jgi:hypothetical protein